MSVSGRDTQLLSADPIRCGDAECLLRTVRGPKPKVDVCQSPSSV